MVSSGGALYEAVFASAKDAMVVADSDMRFVAVNHAACELFGVPESQLLGHRLTDFSLPEDSPSTTFASFLESGQMRGVYHILRPNGDLRLTEYSAVSNVLP